MRLLPTPEDLDDPHRAATTRARFTQGGRAELCGNQWGSLRFCHPEEVADLRDVGLADGAGEQAVVPDTVEAVRQDVDHETTDEFFRRYPHNLLPIPLFYTVIFPVEGHRPR